MRGCFSIRLALVLAAGTIALLVYGINEVTQAAKYRTPIVMTYEQFAAQHPAEGWYRITGCMLSVLDEAHKTKKNNKDDFSSVSDVYVPAFSAKDQPDPEELDKKPISLLVLTQDPQILSTIKNLADKKDDKNAILTYVLQNKDRLFAKRDVEGMLKAGLNAESSETKEQIEAAYSSRTSNAAIMEEGKKPSLGAGLGLTVLGLILAVGQAFFYIVRAGGRATAGVPRT